MLRLQILQEITWSRHLKLEPTFGRPVESTFGAQLGHNERLWLTKETSKNQRLKPLVCTWFLPFCLHLTKLDSWHSLLTFSQVFKDLFNCLSCSECQQIMNHIESLIMKPAETNWMLGRGVTQINGKQELAIIKLLKLTVCSICSRLTILKCESARIRSSCHSYMTLAI